MDLYNLRILERTNVKATFAAIKIFALVGTANNVS